MNRFKTLLLLVLALMLAAAWGCSSGKKEEAAETRTSTKTAPAGPVLQCQERFEKLDVNKDGKVSFEEFSAISHRSGQPQPTFGAKDKDADSFLSLDEFCQGKGLGSGPGPGKQQ